MTTYTRIRSNRRLVWLGIVIALGLTATLAILFLLNRSESVGSTWATAAALLATAIPPALAWVSLDRRPELLAAAAWSALTLAVAGLFQFLPPVHVVPAAIWYLAHRRRPRPVVPDRALRALVLGVAIVVPLFITTIHLDPVCVVEQADGIRVVTTDPDAAAGWRLGGAITSSSTSSGSEGDGVETCFNDSVQWWEAALSGLASVGIIAAGSRWPVRGPRSSTKQPALRSTG